MHMKLSPQLAMTAAFLSIYASLGALGAEYRVGVGKDETTGRKGIGFDPSVIHPIAQDVIAFEFRSGAHSVVQSSFENPCTPSGEFNSGVFTVSNDLTVDAPGLPVVTLVINNTDSLWFFDQAGGLCSEGAVLAVNPTATQTAPIFKENAARAPPGDPSSSSSSSSTPSNPSSSGGASPSGDKQDDVNEPDSADRYGVTLGTAVGVIGSLLFGLYTL